MNSLMTTRTVLSSIRCAAQSFLTKRRARAHRELPPVFAGRVESEAPARQGPNGLRQMRLRPGRTAVTAPTTRSGRSAPPHQPGTRGYPARQIQQGGLSPDPERVRYVHQVPRLLARQWPAACCSNTQAGRPLVGAACRPPGCSGPSFRGGNRDRLAHRPGHPFPGPAGRPRAGRSGSGAAARPASHTRWRAMGTSR